MQWLHGQYNFVTPLWNPNKKCWVKHTHTLKQTHLKIKNQHIYTNIWDQLTWWLDLRQPQVAIYHDTGNLTGFPKSMVFAGETQHTTRSKQGILKTQPWSTGQLLPLLSWSRIHPTHWWMPRGKNEPPKWTKQVLVTSLNKEHEKNKRLFWCFFKNGRKPLTLKKFNKSNVCKTTHLHLLLQNKHTLPKPTASLPLKIRGSMGLENESSIETHWFHNVTPTHNETYLSTTFS